MTVSLELVYVYTHIYIYILSVSDRSLKGLRKVIKRPSELLNKLRSAHIHLSVHTGENILQKPLVC